MKHKISESFKRYLQAEILSVIATLLCSWFTYQLTGNRVTTALAGTWGGNIVYFGYILISDVIQSFRACRARSIPYSKVMFLKDIRSLLLEFGVAELIDGLIIRPALMFYMPIWFGSLTVGVL